MYRNPSNFQSNKNIRRAFALTIGGLLLAALSLPLIAKPHIAGPKGLSLSPREMAFLAQCTLSSIDIDWMFHKTPDDGPGLIFGQRKIGLFLGGAQAVRYDLPIFTCAGKLAGTNWRYLSEATDERGIPYGGIATSIADLSGIPLYGPRQGDQRHSDDVNYYNPEIIRWARVNAIPDPKDSVYGMVTYQEIYDEVFARAFRILRKTDSYLNQKEPGQAQTRFQTYLKIYENADYQQRKKLRDEFTTVYHDTFLGPENDPYQYYFSAGHAATFWFRRGMDGTAGEVRKLMSEVMRKFDSPAK